MPVKKQTLVFDGGLNPSRSVQTVAHYTGPPLQIVSASCREEVNFIMPDTANELSSNYTLFLCLSLNKF